MRTLRVWHLPLLLSALWQLALVAPAAAKPGLADAPDHRLERDAWIVAYRQSAPADKQRALEHLLGDRAGRAAALVLGDAAFVELQAYHAEIRQRVRAGKMLSATGLQTLWDQADALEQSAVEQLARQYASLLHRTLQGDTRAVDQRIEAWRRVYHDWRQAGGRADRQSLLIDWLSVAIERFRHGQFAQLPARPNFAAPDRGTVPPTFAGVRPAESTSPLAAAARLRQRSGQPAAALPAARFAASDAASEQALAPEPSPALLPTATQRPANKPAMQPERPAAARIAERTADPAGGRRIDPAAAVRTLNVPPAVPPDTVVSVADSRAATGAQAQAPRGPRRTTAAAAGYVDLAELRDRLSGYKVAVAALNGRLHEDRIWDAAGLRELVDTFEELVMRRGDLSLYLQLVADEGAVLPALESPQSTISVLSAKISAARLHIERQQDETHLARQHAELAALDQLSRRMAVLAVELQQQK